MTLERDWNPLFGIEDLQRYNIPQPGKLPDEQIANVQQQITLYM